MFGDTMIPVRNAVMMLTMANDMSVGAEDKGSHLSIESMRIMNRKSTTVPIVEKDGTRYVSKKAIDKALREIDAFG